MENHYLFVRAHGIGGIHGSCSHVAQGNALGIIGEGAESPRLNCPENPGQQASKEIVQYDLLANLGHSIRAHHCLNKPRRVKVTTSLSSMIGTPTKLPDK